MLVANATKEKTAEKSRMVTTSIFWTAECRDNIHELQEFAHLRKNVKKLSEAYK